MRRTATATAISIAALGTLLLGSGVAHADVWHFVAHYGVNGSACVARGQDDVRKGWADRYDCRTVSTFPARYDLWEH
jgi:hypothetical protein